MKEQTSKVRNSTTDTQRLRQQVEESRENVRNDLSALDRKLSKENLKQELRENVSEKVHEAGARAQRITRRIGEGATDSFKHNPVPALLIGAGVGYWLYDAYSRGRPRPEQAFQPDRSTPLAYGPPAEGDPSRGATDKVKDRVREVAQDLDEVARNAGESITRAGHQTADRAKRAAHHAQRSARNMSMKSRDFYDENPLLCAGVAVAAGIGIAMALPRTRQEDGWMGGYRDDLFDRAKREAERASEVAKDAASSAVKTAQEEANSREVGAGQLEDQARSVGKELGSAAKAGAEAARKKVRKAYRSDDDAEGETFDTSKNRAWEPRPKGA